MKRFVVLFLMTFILFSCENKDTTTQNQATEVSADGVQDNAEVVAITEVVHNFYAWYVNNAEALSVFQIVNTGKPATINEKELRKYHGELLKSGFLSQIYLDGNLDYLKNLEATDWKNENVEEEPLTGFDYDLLSCSQDYDFEYLTTTSLEIKQVNAEKATAYWSGEPDGQHFELVKENGKWLISAIICQ